MIQSSNDSNIMPQAIISAQKLTQKIQLSQKQLTIFEASRWQLPVVPARENPHC